MMAISFDLITLLALQRLDFKSFGISRPRHRVSGPYNRRAGAACALQRLDFKSFGISRPRHRVSGPYNRRAGAACAVNRNVGGSNPPWGANLFIINHLNEGQKAFLPSRMFASLVLECCELLRCQ